jgi:hypothetical protein
LEEKKVIDYYNPAFNLSKLKLENKRKIPIGIIVITKIFFE